MNTAIVATLQKAKELLEEHGWIKGTSHNDDGYCAAGAIAAVACGHWGHSLDAYFVLRRTIKQETRGCALDVVDWNDQLCQTKDEAIAMFDAAIRYEESV